jgi:hypothetical protein
MHEPRIVGGDQSRRGLDGEVEQPIETSTGARRMRTSPLPQRLAVHQLHRDEDDVAELCCLVNRDDVGMNELRHRLRFTQHARRPFTLQRARWMQHLHRHASVELRIIGRVDDAHASAPERLEQHEATNLHRRQVTAEQPGSVPGPTADYGRYLISACTGCHGEHLSGGPIPGVPPDWPVAANLTWHESGIEGWTEPDFIAAMRTGRTPNGRMLPADYMPWPFIGRSSDDDLRALYLHLRSLEPREIGGR